MADDKSKKSKKVGRPRAIIDWKRVDKYLKAGCIGTEIAATLGIHEDTLYLACKADHKMTFSAYSQQKREIGKCEIKENRYNALVRGMLGQTASIYLWKQMLGETDVQNINLSSTPILPAEFCSKPESSK